jgi:hypothetical protein
MTIQEKAKDAYTKLLNSGMFWELYPELTGNYEEDQDFWFEEYMEQTERMRNK